VTIHRFHAAQLLAACAFTICVAGCADGPANPTVSPAEPVCRGVPVRTCNDQVEAARARSTGAPIATIVVACISTCDDDQGQGITQVVLANGTSTTSAWAYGSSLAAPATTAPTLGITPICEGLPEARCHERLSALPAVTPGGKALQRVVVRCVGVCDDANGRGQTDVTFTDGTGLSFGWEYATRQ
jgi:hypothetical protein